MFDKYIVTPEHTTYVPYEKTIIEKRAPTDESIKLFDEYQKRAQESLIERVHVADNTLNMEGAAFYEHYSDQYVFRYRVLLNGCEISDFVRMNKSATESHRDLYLMAYEKIARQIAEKLINIVQGANIR